MLLDISGDICGLFFVQGQKMPTWQLSHMQSLDIQEGANLAETKALNRMFLFMQYEICTDQ